MSYIISVCEVTQTSQTKEISRPSLASGARWVAAVCKLYGIAVQWGLQERLLLFWPRFVQSSQNTKHAKATHVHSAGLGFHQLALDLQCCCGNFEWKVLWKLAVLTVSKGVSCKFGKSAWQLLQVSKKVRNWVYSRGVGRPRIVSPELQWICHVTTLLFWFCETVGWTAMGRRRQQRAAGRLRWLPSEVRCAIGDGKVHEAGVGAVCSWLGYQIASPLRRGTECSQGVVYFLSGGRASYVGVTSFRRPGSGAKCKLTNACPRYWEHIQDLRKNPNDHQAAARNKRHCFSCVDEAKIAVLELSRGDMELLRVVDKRLISSMCPDANTQHRTESFSLCSGRLRTRARCRPPKRFRLVSLQGVCVGVSQADRRGVQNCESTRLEMSRVQARLETYLQRESCRVQAPVGKSPSARGRRSGQHQQGSCVESCGR